MVLLGAESMCNLEGETLFDLLYWGSELADNLHNASLRDETILRNKFIFCKEYVEMHENVLNKDMRNLGGVRRSYAECYVEKGELGSCDSLYKKWLEQEPDWGWGWIGWADCYWLFSYKGKQNLIKARSILEKGLLIHGIKDKNHMLDRQKLIDQKSRIKINE